MTSDDGMFPLAMRLTVVTVAVLAALAAAVSAQDAAHDARTPAEAARAATEKDCVVDTSEFRQDGRNASFVIELQNNCEKRLKCQVSAFVTTAKGQNSGETILILAPKSEGAASRQAFRLPLRQASGMANASRECDEL